MKKIKHISSILFIIAAFAAIFACSMLANAETEGIYTYTVSGDEATITRVSMNGQSEIIIPETLGGFTVTTIANRALSDRFFNFGDDTVGSVTIPKTVTILSGDPFSYSDLEQIFVDAENENFSSDEYGVLFDKNKTTLIKATMFMKESTYTVPSSVTQLANYAFQACQNIEQINLPSYLSSIGEQAFYNVSSLKEIAISEGVEILGANLFAYCRSLEKITLPSTLKTIREAALTECYALKELIIPEGVRSIGTNAFDNDTALERVVFPSSIQNIGDSACGNCASLGHIYYAGSEDDWGNINIEDLSSSRPNALDTAEFHFDFDISVYDNIAVDFSNDILTISGSGAIPGDDGSFRFWSEHSDSVTAIFIDGSISSLGQGAFSSFDSLAYVIFETEATAIANGAFVDCPKLQSMIFFGAASLASNFAENEEIYVYHPANSALVNSSNVQVVKFSFDTSTLVFDGSVVWDGYQFLDTMTAFCLHFDNIDTISCSDFTFNALPTYGTNTDGEYERIEDNHLVGAKLQASVDDEIVSWNDLIFGIGDGSIKSFRIVASDSLHEEINDTPVTTKVENEGGFIGAVKKALKWIVTLMNKLFNIISRFGK